MGNIRSATYVALLSNIVVFLVKLFASVMTGSVAMLAEALRSLSDIMNQVFLTIGLNLSVKRPSVKYPFGRGKEVFFWSFIASLFVIGGSGIFSLIEGINRVFQPKGIISGEIALIVLGLALMFEFISLINVLRVRYDQKYDGVMRIITRNPIIFIIFVEDVSAIIEILIVFASLYASIYLRLLLFDGLAAIFIGITMIIIGSYIAKHTKEYLIGIGLGPDEIENIRKIILSIPQVNSIIDIKSVYFGVDHVVLGIDINFKDRLTTDEIEHVIDEIERKIKNAYPSVKHIYVEAEDKPISAK